jgi:hypothetical protein
VVWSKQAPHAPPTARSPVEDAAVTDVEIALFRAGLVAIALVTSIDFEKRTGEIPNLVPLVAIVAGLAAGLYSGTIVESLGAMLLLGVPAIFAYTREALRPDAAIWVYALASRKAEWKRLHKPMPRIDASPRIAVLAALGAGSGVAYAFAV